MTSAREFAIVCQPRTGSNMLVGRLDALTDVACHAELFHRRQPYTDMPADRLPPDALRRRNPAEYWRRVVEATRDWAPGARAIGFKLFFIHDWRMHREITRRRLPVVLLRRESRLAQYSSLRIARVTDRWSSRQDDGAEPVRVRFSAVGFVLLALRSRAAYAAYRLWLALHQVPCLYTSYESLVGDPAAFARVCGFLEAEPQAEIDDRYQRQNSADILARFSNPGYARAIHAITRRVGLG